PHHSVPYLQAPGVHGPHAPQGGPPGHDHRHMVAEFKKRFWTSLVLTLPVLILSPMIQHALRLGTSLRFPGDTYVLAVLSSVIYFYGGQPFLQGLEDGVGSPWPGKMTAIGGGSTAAHVFCLATGLGLHARG